LRIEPVLEGDNDLDFIQKLAMVGHIMVIGLHSRKERGLPKSPDLAAEQQNRQRRQRNEISNRRGRNGNVADGLRRLGDGPPVYV
jgi:hypothetical protein